MKKFLISTLFILSVLFVVSCISEDNDKDIIDTDSSENSQNDETGDTGSNSDTQTDTDTDSGTSDPDKTDTASEENTDTTPGNNDDADTSAESDDNDKTDSGAEQNDEDQTDTTTDSNDADNADPTEEPTDADTTDSTDDSNDGDPETGLIDLADWSESSPNKTDWNGAYNYCSAMTEGGHNWHLPTISELRQLVQNCAGTEYNGACGVKDDHLKESDCTYNECAKCTNRYDGGYSKLGDKDYLWSASELDGDPTKVWVINFKSANIGFLAKATAEYGYARCVKE